MNYSYKTKQTPPQLNILFTVNRTVKVRQTASFYELYNCLTDKNDLQFKIQKQN